MVRGQQPNDISVEASLSQRLSSLGKKSQWQKAVVELHEIRSGQGSSGQAPNFQQRPANLAAPRLGVSMYNPVIGASGQAQAWRLAMALAQQMQIDWIEPSVVTHSVLINAFGAGLWARCCQILSGARARALETNVVHYTSLLHACGQAAQVDKALNAFNDIEGYSVQPNLMTFGAAISACTGDFQWQRALAIFDSIFDKHLTPNLICYNAALSALEKGRRPELAITSLNEMSARSISPDVVSYSTVISACEGGSLWSTAVCTLVEMQLKNVQPNIVTFSAAISACEKGRQQKKALELLQMQKDQVPLSLVSYGAAISACEKAKCWEEAMNLMQEMPSVQLEPNLVCFNSLLSSLMAAHKADEALELLSILRDTMKPDVISFSTTLSACARSFRWQEALSTLSLMLHDVLEPNCVSYDAVVHACEKQGQINSLFASATLLSAVSRQGVDMCEVLL